MTADASPPVDVTQPDAPEPSPSDAERHPVIEGALVVALPWRRPSDNAAEQLVRRAGWNVIEGEEH